MDFFRHKDIVVRGTELENDPRIDKAFKMLQTVWNLSYLDVEVVEVLFGPDKRLERSDRRPPLKDYECQWLAIWFPWSWKQIRLVFPVDFETVGMTKH